MGKFFVQDKVRNNNMVGMYEQGYTQKAIALKFNVTQARVSQVLTLMRNTATVER